MALAINDRVGLASDQREGLEKLLASHRVLQDVVRWRMVSDVIAHDEYTLDVIVAWEAGLVLVYDTT